MNLSTNKLCIILQKYKERHKDKAKKSTNINEKAKAFKNIKAGKLNKYRL